MPQQTQNRPHGSLRGQAGSLRRGNLTISQPILIAREGRDGLGPQALRVSDQPSITSLRQLRQSQSSTVSASRRQTYGAASSHTPQDSVSTSVSQDSALHRRRGSALKSVMRKLFGRKRRSQLEEGEGDSEGPSALTIERDDRESGPSRTTFPTGKNPLSINDALDITANKRSTAVSHLSSPSSEHMVRISISQDPTTVPRKGLRRRATLPSLVLSDDDARETAMSVVFASSTRPASEVTEEHDHEREQSIRGKSRPSLQAHRRSRSADALREILQHHRMSPIQWRRRSDEMKHWRTSILELDHDRSVQSTRPQTGTTARTTTTVSEEDEQPEQPEKPEQPEQPADDRVSTPQVEPEAAPFNLQNLIGSMEDTGLTLQQRVTTLEVKIMDLEFAIAKIQGASTGALPGGSAQQTPQKGVASGDRQGCRTQGQTLAPEPPSAVSDDSSSGSSSLVEDSRPISTGTLRPNMAFTRPPVWHTPSSSTPNLNFSIEQYSALVTLVRREQTARKALEDQVSQLQDEMYYLRQAGILPESLPGTLYPIPSPDFSGQRRSRRLLQDRITIGSDTVDSSYAELRHWGSRDSPYFRSNVEVTPRNAVTGMI